VEAIMEYKTVKQLEQVAEVHPQSPVMSRSERLERWAVLLEQQPNRRLNTFFETEYENPARRDALRPIGSPISVAFEDPRLRAAGLKGDTYGEAKGFFDVSDWELHMIVCYCHYGAIMSARTAASAVRAIIAETAHPSVVGWARRHLDRLVF
jgi:hypothetical protein